MRKSHKSSLQTLNAKSLYDKNDYRSFLFKGDWIKHMLLNMILVLF